MADTSRSALGRRVFLRGGSLFLAAAGLSTTSVFADPEDKPALKIGLVTDLHHADRTPGGSRHYRETPDKLAEAASQFQKHSPKFLVELGDFIDAADSVEKELGYQKAWRCDHCLLVSGQSNRELLDS